MDLPATGRVSRVSYCSDRIGSRTVPLTLRDLLIIVRYRGRSYDHLPSVLKSSFSISRSNWGGRVLFLEATLTEGDWLFVPTKTGRAWVVCRNDGGPTRGSALLVSCSVAFVLAVVLERVDTVGLQVSCRTSLRT